MAKLSLISRQTFFVLGSGLVLIIVNFFALNPRKHLADVRNHQRYLAVRDISSALQSYISDHNDTFQTVLHTNTKEAEIGTCLTAGCSGVSSCVNLAPALADYLQPFPVDPSKGNQEQTGYTIAVNGDNVVTISACYAENSETITVIK